MGNKINIINIRSKWIFHIFAGLLLILLIPFQYLYSQNDLSRYESFNPLKIDLYNEDAQIIELNIENDSLADIVSTLYPEISINGSATYHRVLTKEQAETISLILSPNNTSVIVDLKLDSSISQKLKATPSSLDYTETKAGNDIRDSWGSILRNKNMCLGDYPTKTPIVIGYSESAIDKYGGADWAFEIPPNFGVSEIQISVKGKRCDTFPLVGGHASLTMRKSDWNWLSDDGWSKNLPNSLSTESYIINSQDLLNSIEFDGGRFFVPIISSTDNYNVEWVKLKITYFCDLPSTPTGASATRNECDKIIIDWNFDNNVDGYKILRGDKIIENNWKGSMPYEDTGGASYTDHLYKIYAINKCGESENYEYAKGYKLSSPDSPSWVTATTDNYDKIYIDWPPVDNADGYYIYIDNQEEVYEEITGSTDFSDLGTIPGEEHTYKVYAYNNSCGESANYASATGVKPIRTGTISGNVVTSTDSPIGVIGVRITTDPGGYFSDTNADGAYTISGIEFGNSTTYTLTPEKLNHDFTPTSREVTLSTNSQNANGIDFKDVSSFNISTTIKYGDNDCNVSGVDLFVNDNISPSGVTDEQGNSSIALGMGTYTITPKLEGHLFNPKTITITVDNNAEIAFSDTTHYDLGGFVLGSCDIPLGSGTVTLTTPSGCMTTNTTQIQDDGFYSFEVHPMKYNISVNVIGHELKPKTINLQSDSTDINFIKRGEIITEIEGFPDELCGMTVVNQGQEYKLKISVSEKNGSIICPVKIGKVVINDNVNDTVSNSVEIKLENGVAEYYLVPGEPNILTGGGHDYQKQLEIKSISGDSTIINTIWVVVAGHKPREEEFQTVTPQLPLIILRDPPGDASYSYISNTNTIGITTSLSYEVETGGGASITANIGPPIGFSGSIGGSIDFSSKAINQYEYEISYTTIDNYKTSSEESFIGNEGDLFVGAAFNVFYSVHDELTIDESCNILVTPNLYWRPDSIETEYVYTESHIQNYVIPEAISTGKEADVELWQSVLDMNQFLKDSAIFKENKNISWDSGSEKSSSLTTTIKNTTTLGFNLNVVAEIKAELNAKGPLLGGVQSSAYIRAGLTYGNSTKASNFQSNTVGYMLDDNDEGDVFTVDIYEDPVFGTPIFKLIGGATSCPWESNTQPREGVTFNVEPSERIDVDPSSMAEFDLLLGNTSQSKEIREYRLSVLHNTNSKGAIVKVNGQTIEDYLMFTIEPDSQITALLTIERQSSDRDFDFENIGLRFYSGCDSQISDTINVSAHFTSPCLKPIITSPQNNWVINQDNNNVLDITITGYSLENDELQSLALYYFDPDTNDWIIIESVLRENITENILTIHWETENIKDGEYKLRVDGSCSSSDTESNDVSGLIDRTPPMIFGKPKPLDGVLGIDDEIQVSFTEKLKCSTVNNDCIVLRNFDTGKKINTNVTCSGNSIIITPLVDDSEIENTYLKVEISCIEDIYGNIISEGTGNYSWSIYVDRSTIYWSPADQSINIMPGDSAELSSSLINRGSQVIPFNLIKVPSWITPIPLSGTLHSKSSEKINFDIVSGLSEGLHRDTLYAKTSFGDEPLYISLTIAPNSVPIITTISDTSMLEDGTLEIFLGAFDAEGDTCIFKANSDTNAVTCIISENLLSIQPKENWNGSAIIFVSASDETGSDSLSFEIIVHPVNDPPSVFSLKSPINNTVVYLDSANRNNTLQFLWEESADVDGDKLQYKWTSGEELSFLDFGTINDTSVQRTYQEIAVLMKFYEISQASGAWTICAMDGTDSTFAKGNARTLIIDCSSLLAVDVGETIPTQFALHDNYPNPFNSKTAINFDIPEPTPVAIIVYDILGNHIINIVGENVEPGSYQVIWNAKNKFEQDVPSGIYIAQMVTNAFVKNIKMVLLK